MPILKFYSPFKHFSVLFKWRYGRKIRKCEGVTIYKCLECFTFACNICSKFRDHDIYNEEEKLTGKLKIVMEIKQQSNGKATTNTRSKNKNKTKQNKKQKKLSKLMNILRCNKNLLTVTEWLQ